VTHPGQFEPWTTKRREIEGLSPDDPRYQSAARIADAVLSGHTPDPTAGATHFLNPTIVRERRSGELPSWARGEGLLIGSHTFYFPEGDEPNHGLND
jgi:spore germination cell wall hydrolase CwlJ-like protein